uniref:Uncharacterized protein n=1 Tax=Vespula pensylvanica TaxID=30213 RepID=A0A834U4H1_VESPE|nr:hypothetical protein H0235_012405 [Vespula pensylvanica]
MGLLMFLAVTASILGHCQTDEKGSPTEIPREPCRKEYHVLPFPQVLFPFPRPKLEYGLEFAFVTLRKIYKKTVLPLRTYTLSFYGASYIHLPVQEAKGATDISFRFRTHLSDAMLLLAAGKTDYCLIKLEAGRLKVRLP